MNFLLGKYYMQDGIQPIRLKVTSPIEWVPLESKGNETFLMSRYVIDWELFAFDENVSGWTDSYLKSYLNDLYNNNFNEMEKECIQEKSLGKIFVLSAEEIIKYMPDAVDRRAQIHFVGKEDDVTNISIVHSKYWLRNDSLNEDGEAAFIDDLGDIEYETVQTDEIGIRPCMYVDTKKARKLTAWTGFNPYHHFWEFDEF